MRYLFKQKPNMSEGDYTHLMQELGVSALTAQVLQRRGWSDPDAARQFLEDETLLDPFLFQDMRRAVELIQSVIAAEGVICVYGDYDVDGTSACAILFRALRYLHANVFCFLPNRMQHGYGLSIENLNEIKHANLLITVDCGITNITEIAYARELGMQVILSDHHECPAQLPEAQCILNPKRSTETYPFRDLCGAGIAFKLAQALTGKQALEWIDLAAVATIADIVPLLGENRVIAKRGIRRLGRHPNVGLKALIQKSGIKRDKVDAQTIAFSLAPRINAAGRIASAQTAFDLLISDEKDACLGYAEQLCEMNYQRQQRQERVIQEALDMELGDEQDRVILLYKEDWDIGIVGLAASKICELHAKPTILLGESGGFFTGSARSVDGVNIYEALHSQHHLYEKFGGHSGAAGLTIRREHLETLRERLNEYIKERYDDEVFRPVKHYDLQAPIEAVSTRVIQEFEQMEPFGFKNEQVDILFTDVSIEEVRAIGEDRHAKFVAVQGAARLNAVVFGTRAAMMPQQADLVGCVTMNPFDEKPQLVVGTLSFDENLQQLFEQSCHDLRIARRVVKVKALKYYCDREKLLELFLLLKSIAQKKISFLSQQQCFEFILKYAQDVDIYKLAFVFCVFEEIGLLGMKKNDRIHLVIHEGKRDLAQSQIYAKYLEEAAKWI